MGTKFEKDPLAVEQDNHATKVVNSYIVYDLDAWPNNTLKNFKLKNNLFHEINTAKTTTTTTTKNGYIMVMELQNLNRKQGKS